MPGGGTYFTVKRASHFQNAERAFFFLPNNKILNQFQTFIMAYAGYDIHSLGTQKISAAAGSCIQIRTADINSFYSCLENSL